MDSCTGGTYDNCNSSAESMRMSYDSLKTFTDGFSKVLGSGSFGVVYKGVLANGKEIAVKELRDTAALDEKNFINEFQNLARLKHQNIVQLVGYCNESEDQIVYLDNGTKVTAAKMHVALCFEYVENGSLHPFISGENQLFKWDTCYKIIKGICEGLKHLREGLDNPVWHLDLKPANILLDNNMMPKIADFGLSRLIGDENTRRTINLVGTCGYSPPEYVDFQLISGAFDIFSLGVIITKIMVGSKDYNDCADMKPRNLVKHVQNIWKIKLKEIVRPRSLELYCRQVKACIELASKCLSKDRSQRPQIQEIIMNLNETETMMIPNIRLDIEQFQEGKTNVPSNRSIKVISSSEMDNTTIDRDALEEKLHDPTASPICLPFEFLKDITCNFSEEQELGRGGYGVVYKGVLRSGKIIAVKLFRNLVDDEQFLEEVTNLIGVKHQNIVQLVGYCVELRTEARRLPSWILVTAQIPKRLLCFEYLSKNSLEKHISDESQDGLDWCTCYKIIKGTCDGLCYLHEGFPSPIMHLNLKPSNILLDKNMDPKIGDIGLSRLLGDEETDRTIGSSRTIEHIPPEFVTAQVKSTKFDIYSLGIIIMRMTGGYSIPGEMKSHELIKLVHGKWRKRIDATLKGRSMEGYCKQVKKCLKIALGCVEEDRHERPSIGEIIRMLNETETLIHDEDNHKLLDVHPMELQFPAKPKRHASCLLQLHNKQDNRVMFRLVSKNPRRYFTNLPLYGVVPRRCTYTLSLTTNKQPHQPSQESDEGFELYSIAVSDRKQYIELAEYESHFSKAKETAGNEVQEVALKSVCALQCETGSSDNVCRPKIEVIATLNAKYVLSIEVHPTQQWFMTTHRGGYLRVWNYDTLEEVLNLFEALDKEVCVAKFVAREEWIVAGDSNGWIHVCSYDESQDAISFEAHSNRIMSLAVHPSNSYVLSSSDDNHLIKLWHWDPYWNFEKGGWVCSRTFDGHYGKVSQVIFNPEDMGSSFASVSIDRTAKIWSLDSDVCKTFDDHPDGLLCVDYLTGVDGQHRIITGSMDGTAQIWDLKTKRRIENLEGHQNQICVVYCNPELEKLITGSLDGTVRIWDSATYRLENVIAFNLGAVYGFGYIEHFQRIVVGCHEGIAMMKINAEVYAVKG